MSKLIDWIKKDRKLWKEILLGALVVPILAFDNRTLFAASCKREIRVSSLTY